MYITFRNMGEVQVFSLIDDSRSGEEKVIGFINIEKSDARDPQEGPAAGAYIVKLSDTKQSGTGPLLYDVAMEWATLNGGGLTSDKFSISPDAKRVWDFYMNKRPDVQVYQLDNMKNVLTPDSSDNVYQGTAYNKHPGEYRGVQLRSFISKILRTWVDSSLSKRYTKKPTTINALKRLGKWRKI